MEDGSAENDGAVRPGLEGGTPAGASKRLRGRPPLDRDAQRAKILAAASHLFIENGFFETTLDAIGKAAGVTKRTIYQHVGDKDALLRAVCHEMLPLAMKIRMGIRMDEERLHDVIFSIARRLLDATLAPEAVALQRMIMTVGTRFPQLFTEVIEEGMAALNGNIAVILQELVRDRGLPPIDAAQAADLFYDAIVGNRSFRMTMGHRETLPDDKELAQRVTMFLRGHMDYRE